MVPLNTLKNIQGPQHILILYFIVFIPGWYVGNEDNISISETGELKYIDNNYLEIKSKSKINYFKR